MSTLAFVLLACLSVGCLTAPTEQEKMCEDNTGKKRSDKETWLEGGFKHRCVVKCSGSGCEMRTETIACHYEEGDTYLKEGTTKTVAGCKLECQKKFRSRRSGYGCKQVGGKKIDTTTLKCKDHSGNERSNNETWINAGFQYQCNVNCGGNYCSARTKILACHYEDQDKLVQEGTEETVGNCVLKCGKGFRSSKRCSGSIIVGGGSSSGAGGDAGAGGDDGQKDSKEPQCKDTTGVSRNNNEQWSNGGFHYTCVAKCNDGVCSQNTKIIACDFAEEGLVGQGKSKTVGECVLTCSEEFKSGKNCNEAPAKEIVKKPAADDYDSEEK